MEILNMMQGKKVMQDFDKVKEDFERKEKT